MSTSRVYWTYEEVVGEVVRRLEDKEEVSLRQVANAYGCHDGSILVESRPNKELPTLRRGKK